MSDVMFHMIPDAPKPVAPYSDVVGKDGWLFITGQLATDPVDGALPIPPGIEKVTLLHLHLSGGRPGRAPVSLSATAARAKVR
jgi:enamine deaminase RidA (YjgF/YER057c/UK114 family)